MKPSSPFYAHEKINFSRFSFTAITIVCLLFCLQASAKYQGSSGDSSNAVASEKKVDYLEKIYFSGGNKEELQSKIEYAISLLQLQPPTKSLAKQATFLLDIKGNAEQASNACEILDLLAVGIYKIDPLEASQQGVLMPSEKAKKKSANAIGALDQLSKSSYDLSNTAHGAAWESYMLSGGNYGGFVSGASKIGNTADKIGGTVKVAGGIVKTGKDAKDLADKFFKKKDNPCDKVSPKEIEIGNHTPDIVSEVPKVINTSAIATNVAQSKSGSSGVTLLIKNCSYKPLQAIVPAIEKISGVTAAKSNSLKENVATLSIITALNPLELAGKVIEASKPLKLEVESFSDTEAILIVKP